MSINKIQNCENKNKQVVEIHLNLQTSCGNSPEFAISYYYNIYGGLYEYISCDSRT